MNWKTLTRFVAAGALATTLGVGGLSATSGAAVTYGGARASTVVTCDPFVNELRLSPTVGVMSGYSSQYVAFRVAVYNSVTAQWSWTNWSTPAVASAQGPTMWLSSMSFKSTPGARLTVYMQYDWYAGGKWVAPVGEYMSSYQEAQFLVGSYTSSTCTV
ncbi:MAG: hypothetical protein ACXVJ7_11310 [Acidimicrobiia bacterium]